MEIVSSDTESLCIPREKIELPEGLRLGADTEFTICFGENDDPQADFMAVTLLCQRESVSTSADFEIVFREKPPLRLFEDAAAVCVRSLIEAVTDEQAEKVPSLIGAAVNRVLTPLSRLVIEKRDHWLDLWLVIGEWEGHYQARLSELKHLFEL
jgi:hypothetical protein